MRLVCDRRVLQDALAPLARVAGRGEGPAASVRVTAGAAGVRLAAADRELAVECRAPAEVARAGESTVPARLLLEIVAQLPDGPITLDAGDTGPVWMICERSEYHLPALAVGAFPPLPAVDEGAVARFAVPGAPLRRSIRQVLPAAATDETRPLFTGVFLSVTADEAAARLSLVATDTYRLAEAVIDGVGPHSLEPGVAPAPADLSAVVPRRAMGELARLLTGVEEAVSVAVDGSHVEFRLPSARLVARRIAGQYPKWEHLVPSAATARLALPAAALAAAVRRAALVARGDGERLLLRSEGEALLLVASAADGGRAREEVPARHEGAAVEVALDARYLIEILEAIPTERVLLETGDPRRPVLFRPEGDATFRALLAPMARE